MNLSYIIFTKYLDKGILEIIGPFGFYIFFKKLNTIVFKSVTPLIFFYIYLYIYKVLLFGTIVFFLLYLFFLILI